MTNSNKKAMQTIDLPALIQTPSYSFLNTDPHLRDRIIFLALGGSYAQRTRQRNGRPAGIEKFSDYPPTSAPAHS